MKRILLAILGLIILVAIPVHGMNKHNPQRVRLHAACLKNKVNFADYLEKHRMIPKDFRKYTVLQATPQTRAADLAENRPVRLR
jgi:hypothetical protein